MTWSAPANNQWLQLTLTITITLRQSYIGLSETVFCADERCNEFWLSGEGEVGRVGSDDAVDVVLLAWHGGGVLDG